MFLVEDLNGQLNFVMLDLVVLGCGFLGGLMVQVSVMQVGGVCQIKLIGCGMDLWFGQQDVDGVLIGEMLLDLDVEECDGNIMVCIFNLNNQQFLVIVQGMLGVVGMDMIGQVDVRLFVSFGCGWWGVLNVQGSFCDDGIGVWLLDVIGIGCDLFFGQVQFDGVLIGVMQFVIWGIECDGIFWIEIVCVENFCLNLNV